MATMYRCDTCGQVSESLDGWLLIGINFMHWDPNVPAGTLGRMLDSAAPDRLFDKPACRDAWCVKADVPVPTSPPVIPLRQMV